MVNTTEILKLLIDHYPEAKTSLHYTNPFELLVAVMLSARSTDEQVNLITPGLFCEFSNAFDMARASADDIELLIRKCGLYKNKSKNLVETARILVNKYNGHVPERMEDLLSLPGVGRKTANVVRSNLFGHPAIAVDTHVYRVSRRLGLAEGKTPYDVEKQLMKRIPVQLWSETHHRLILHGRSVCHSKKPVCESCILKKICLREGL